MAEVDPGGFTSQYAADDALVPLTDAECQALCDVLWISADAWWAWASRGGLSDRTTLAEARELYL